MQNNPFKNLKGFSVLASDDKPAEPRERPVARPASLDTPASFAEEMVRLGVQRIVKPQGAAAAMPTVVEAVVESAAPAVDEELFAAALGKLDTVFVDQYPDDEEPVVSAPRRMKQLRQGKSIPEATLDLHGATRDEARAKVRYFLENAVYHGMKTVLIVTGWGRGSGGESVLRGEIEQYLAGDGRAWVAEWGRAPKQHGGDGALVVFLKSADKVT
jgi:hypothetical protein